MLNLLAFFAENTLAEAIMIIRIVLSIVVLLCAGFIIFAVLKQSGNTDGTEALSGSSAKDDKQSYYGQNKSSSWDHRFKIMTYIASGILAVAAIVFVILG